MCEFIWKILDTGIATAQENMAIDRLLLRNLATNRQPVLHFYEWTKPSITHGYFIDPCVHLNEQVVRSEGIDLAARPTGGGIVMHLTDFAFSLLIPSEYPGLSSSTLQNYAFVNQRISEAIKLSLGLKENPSLFSCREKCSSDSPSFCMATPSAYDVMWNGKKIAGGAQRRTRHGLLHQGTICTSSPDEKLLRRLVRDGKTIDAILVQKAGNQIDKCRLKEAIMKVFSFPSEFLANCIS